MTEGIPLKNMFVPIKKETIHGLYERCVYYVFDSYNPALEHIGGSGKIGD